MRDRTEGAGLPGAHGREECLRQEETMSLVLLILLILILVGGLPTWGYHSYGYGPSGAAGLVLMIVVIMLLMGRI